MSLYEVPVLNKQSTCVRDNNIFVLQKYCVTRGQISRRHSSSVTGFTKSYEYFGFPILIQPLNSIMFLLRILLIQIIKS